MSQLNKGYIFLEATTSLCPLCLRAIPAKIVQKNEQVFLLKNCKIHGEQWELLEDDLFYYRKKSEFDKPGTISETQTSINRGCPFDCGLCPQHEQHTCIGLIEVTNNCNLKCNICYANAGSETFLSLKRITAMMDFYQQSEGGKAEILQISGGEPTTHPEIINIIKLARMKGFKFVMLNTNGIRIANDPGFVNELEQFRGGFEVYLQFDGFEKETQLYFRGKDLTPIKLQAVKNLAQHKIPITLVATVGKGINDHEVGAIIDFGMRTNGVRGVNFQPLAYFGRAVPEKRKNRLTISGLLKEIEIRTLGKLKVDDFIPLPCNVHRVALTYLYKQGGEFIPITRRADIREYLPLINNTFAFYFEDFLKTAGRVLSQGEYYCECLKMFQDIMRFLPIELGLKSKAERAEFVENNTFRISISSFLDAYNFDLKSMQKECVHIITSDLKRIPFSAYNMLHRGANGENDSICEPAGQNAG